MAKPRSLRYGREGGTLMEPKTAKEILSPLFEFGTEAAKKQGATPEQLEQITEALETLDHAISWAQLTWDHSFPAWLQHCSEQKAKQANRPERRRLEVVKK